MGKQQQHDTEAASRQRLQACMQVLTLLLQREGLQQPHSLQRNCLQGEMKTHQQRPLQAHTYCGKTVLTWPLEKYSICSGSHLLQKEGTDVFTSIFLHLSPLGEKRDRGLKNISSVR